MSADDDEEAIKNSVLVCIIPTHLILLKEHWESWVFLKNPETLRDYKKQAVKKGGATVPEPKEDVTHGNEDDGGVQAAMEERCNPNSSASKIFKVVTMIEMS